MVMEVLRDPERKSIPAMLRDLLNLWIRHKEIPIHYFSRYLFKRDVANILDYIPNRLSGRIAPYFNDGRLKHVLDNKLYFYLYYSNLGIPTPKVVAFNHQNLFAANEETYTINSLDDFIRFISNLFITNSGLDCIFLKRIYSSSSGRNIFLICADQIEKRNPLLAEIYENVVGSEFIFQHKVRQHPDLEQLNPYSLNTMRIDTFIDRFGNIDVISGFLKMSTNNLPVDNNISGGCGVGINLTTGRLRKNGYYKLRVNGVTISTSHPITGIKFEDFQVPHLDEAVKLVKEAASLMPGLRLVGWDVGFSEEGPVVIEGNSDYGINSNDLMYGGYFANENFNKVLSEFEGR
jgi:hypothetical protein